jgi:hypothetical protein
MVITSVITDGIAISFQMLTEELDVVPFISASFGTALPRCRVLYSSFGQDIPNLLGSAS